jgi:hypothetical protein
MLSLIAVNPIAILICGIAAMALGFLWYSNVLFAKPWMKLVGLSEKDLKGGPGAGYAITFVLALVLAVVLKHILVWANATNLSDALKTGLLLGFGFVLPVMAPNYIFVQKPTKLMGIDIGYQIVNVLVMSVILTIWA